MPPPIPANPPIQRKINPQPQATYSDLIHVILTVAALASLALGIAWQFDSSFTMISTTGLNWMCAAGAFGLALSLVVYLCTQAKEESVKKGSTATKKVAPVAAAPHAPKRVFFPEGPWLDPRWIVHLSKQDREIIIANMAPTHFFAYVNDDSKIVIQRYNRSFVFDQVQGEDGMIELGDCYEHSDEGVKKLDDPFESFRERTMFVIHSYDGVAAPMVNNTCFLKQAKVNNFVRTMKTFPKVTSDRIEALQSVLRDREFILFYDTDQSEKVLLLKDLAPFRYSPYSNQEKTVQVDFDRHVDSFIKQSYGPVTLEVLEQRLRMKEMTNDESNPIFQALQAGCLGPEIPKKVEEIDKDLELYAAELEALIKDRNTSDEKRAKYQRLLIARRPTTANEERAKLRAQARAPLEALLKKVTTEKERSALLAQIDKVGPPDAAETMGYLEGHGDAPANPPPP